MVTEMRGDIELAKNEQEMDGAIYPETEMINQKLEWFKDQKLGVIFHWGLYAEAGIVESWQLSEKDEWARGSNPWREDIKVLQRDYWNLIETFNPVEFNAKELAKLCKEAGFKYMIFTTKHHDGFHMWDTKQSDYKIGGPRSPLKRDLYGEVVEAFRAEGLGIGAYYSKADWYSPYYWSDPTTIKGRGTDYDTKENPELWAKYVDFVHNELEEITQNYGPVDILWLDAGWCGQGKEDLLMDEMAQKVRKTNPDLLIVDRMMGGRHENYVTPERKIPTVSEIPKKAWESNIPFANNWGYVPNDHYKSSREIIINVIDVVSKGGNIILGFGPDGKGICTEESIEIVTDLGNWLKQNGEGIYGTRALAHQIDNRKWYLTKKETAIYAYYPFESELDETITISKSELENNEIKNIQTLDKDEPVTFEIREQDYVLKLPDRTFAWDIVVLKISL
jgi:alpha-L-fucosidase